MVLIHDVSQRSPEWFKLREGRWTGSTAIKLLQGKPLPTEFSDYQSPAMLRGQVLEPIALQEFSVQTGIDTLSVGFVTNNLYPNAGYSPDGIVGDTLLEVKCLNDERHEALARGEIPLEYLAQIYFGMVICELDKARLLAFNPEYERQLTILEIEYDPVITDNIVSKLKTPTKL